MPVSHAHYVRGGSVYCLSPGQPWLSRVARTRGLANSNYRQPCRLTAKWASKVYTCVGQVYATAAFLHVYASESMKLTA